MNENNNKNAIDSERYFISLIALHAMKDILLKPNLCVHVIAL